MHDTRIEAHIFIAFLAYCLHVTLSRRLYFLAPGLTPRTGTVGSDLVSCTQGNLIKTTNALGQETLVTQHDAHGRPLSLTDPNGLLTELAYDARGRLQRQSVDGQVTSFAYDGVGNVTGLTLPTGASLRYTYDAAHRLTAIQDSTGNTITYTLDPLGNRIQEEITDPAGALTRTHSRVRYGYDGRGDLISVQTTRDGIMHTMGYAYNGADQVMSIAYPSGRTVDYQRNTLGQISGATTTLNGETQTLASNIAYAPFGPLSGLTFGNGVPLIRALDLDYRLTANVHLGVFEQGFTFDAADNISAIDDN